MHDIFVETRTIIDAENSPDRAGDRTNRPADDCPKRAGVSVADSSAFLCALNSSLCLSPRYWRCQYHNQKYLQKGFKSHVVLRDVFQPHGLGEP